MTMARGKPPCRNRAPFEVEGVGFAGLAAADVVTRRR
jgi:hypothetical protein